MSLLDELTRKYIKGKVSLERCPCATWEIPDFFELPLSTDFIQSTKFHFNDDAHCLRMYPYMKVNENGGSLYTAIELGRFTPYFSSERDGSYIIGCKSITGKEFEFEKKRIVHITERYMFTVKRSFLSKRKNTHVPEGTLTIFCRMRLEESSIARRLQSDVGETPFVDHALASHQDGEPRGLSSVDKLHSDYKHLLLKGAESDACLVVSGKEFQVHRNILRARSPVFDAMFGHETTEKESGRVVIDDLDVDSFPDFLEYVYTGRVEAFSNDNAFGVYVAADKYQLHTLKSECLEYMSKNMSVDSFCDVMNLALRHDEADLMKQAVEFFKKNLTGIILTVKWQQFMSKNSTAANELLIKALVSGDR